MTSTASIIHCGRSNFAHTTPFVHELLYFFDRFNGKNWEVFYVYAFINVFFQLQLLVDLFAEQISYIFIIDF